MERFVEQYLNQRKIITRLLDYFMHDKGIDMGYWPTDSFETTVDSYCKYARENGFEEGALKTMSVTISEIINNELQDTGKKYDFIDYSHSDKDGFVEYSVEDIKKLIKRYFD